MRVSRFAPTLEQFTRLSTDFIKQLDLKDGLASTTLVWYEGKRAIGSVFLTVRLDYLQPRFGELMLESMYDKQLIRYTIDLVQVPSNLGKKGGIWYFICPLTNKRCRILYLVNMIFVSRYALKGVLYKSQTYSKQYRSVAGAYGPEFKLDEAYEELYKPYAKKTYRGQPTPKAKKVLKLERKIR